MGTDLTRKSGGAGVSSVLLSFHREHTVKERLHCTKMKEKQQASWQSSPDSLAAPVVSETLARDSQHRILQCLVVLPV